MAYAGKTPFTWPFTKADIGLTKESTTGQRVGVAIGIIIGLGLVGVALYYLWRWLQHRRTTVKTPDATVTDIFGPIQIYHTSVVEHDKPHHSTNPVPPGNYPISACSPTDFHEHVAKQYGIYGQEKNHKAFVSNNACSHAYYAHSQPDAHRAVEITYPACQKREPGRCGVVSVDGAVYSHK